MTVIGGRRILAIFCGLAAVAMAGCADLDILPYWVPFQGAPSDKVAGVTPPSEQIAEIKKLSARAVSASPEEKQRISTQLVASIRSEQDPLIRVEILRALGHYPGPEADTILKKALTDADAHVRVAACEAWGKHRDAQAVKLLSEAMRSDAESDVRLAAAKALGETKNADAVAALGEALDDTDPTLQYRAVLSLKEVTGKDLGDNVGRWQQYVKGETPAPPPSLAERIRRMF